MKKLITAAVCVAFMGAVAFASLQGNTASGKKTNSKEQKQKEVKKKECKHTCPFSGV